MPPRRIPPSRCVCTIRRKLSLRSSSAAAIRWLRSCWRRVETRGEADRGHQQLVEVLAISAVPGRRLERCDELIGRPPRRRASEPPRQGLSAATRLNPAMIASPGDRSSGETVALMPPISPTAPPAVNAD